MTNMDRWYQHLDVCAQCRKQPFNLCKAGQGYLAEAATKPYETAK